MSPGRAFRAGGVLAMVPAVVCAVLTCAATAYQAPGAAPGVAPASGDVLVRLASGDTIRGAIVERLPGAVVVRHPVLGVLTIPNDQIVELQPAAPAVPAPVVPAAQGTAPQAAPVAAGTPAPPAPPTPRPAPVAPSATDGAGAQDEASPLPVGPSSAEASADDAPPPTPPKGPWRATIAAAINYTNNNDTTIDARLAGGLTYKVEDVETLALSAEYFFKTLNSSTTDNNLLVNTVYDRYIEQSAWLWFVKAQYQYSQFEAWEHRISGYSGLGYQFFKLPPIDLLVKIGAGGTYEFGPPEQTLPEGYGEVQFAWEITSNQRLEFSSNIAPDLSDFGEYRIISRAEWQCKIDPALDLALTVGIRSQYQSKVPAGDVNHDLRLYAGVQLGF